MFSKAIYNTTLTSEAANRLFSNISASYTKDSSFLATLRALLQKRLPPDKTVKVTCRGVQFTESGIMMTPASERMNLFIPDPIRHLSSSGHTICIMYATEISAGAKMLEIVRANAGAGKRHMSEYNRRDDLQVFFARKVNALFYTDVSERHTVIFTDKLELKHFHALQMMIPKYLPSLFADNPLTEMESFLLKSCGNKSAVEYERLIEEFTKDLDIHSEIIRIKLAGFETVFERMRADELRKEIDSFQKDYDYYITLLRDSANKLQERKYTLAGLMSAIEEQTGDSELMEYFMCNKNLTIIQVRGTAIEFVVHGYADVYDIDAFEQYADNHNGYLYSNLNYDISRPQMEKLYRAIFSEGIYKLRICAAFTADMRTGLQARQHYVFPSESQTYLHNPHIQSYGCIGSYAGRFQEYMQRKDYVGAIDQAVVSARNLNFYDSSVMTTFANELSCTAIKCIETQDGTLFTPLEAIAALELTDTLQEPTPETDIPQNTTTAEEG